MVPGDRMGASSNASSSAVIDSALPFGSLATNFRLQAIALEDLSRSRDMRPRAGHRVDISSGMRSCAVLPPGAAQKIGDGFASDVARQTRRKVLRGILHPPFGPRKTRHHGPEPCSRVAGSAPGFACRRGFSHRVCGIGLHGKSTMLVADATAMGCARTARLMGDPPPPAARGGTSSVCAFTPVAQGLPLARASGAHRVDSPA